MSGKQNQAVLCPGYKYSKGLCSGGNEICEQYLSPLPSGAK